MESPKLNILIYTRDFDLPTFIKKLGKHLNHRGHQVTFMGHSSNPIPIDNTNSQIKSYRLPFYHETMKLFKRSISIGVQLLLVRPQAIRGIMRTLKNDYYQNWGVKGRRQWLIDFIRLGACKIIQPDVIHNQWSPALAPLAPLFEHYPIVQSLHGRLEDVTPFHDQGIASIYKKFFPKVKGFQSASKHLLDNASLFGASRENSFISYSMVEKAYVRSRPSDEGHGSTLKIISAGKFAWRKGYIHALDAMAILKKRGISFHYTIVGWGDPTAINFHIADLQLQKEVSLINDLPHDQTLDQVKQSDLFLLPSVEEGFATVVSEAMALQKPVISTNCGGMGELIVNHHNGWLIPPRNPEAIAEAVEHFLKLTPDEVEGITQNAKQLVEDQLTWERQIDKFISLYQNSLKQ